MADGVGLAFIRAIGSTARAGVNVVASAQSQQQSRGRGRKRTKKVAECTPCAAFEMVDKQKERIRGGSL